MVGNKIFLFVKKNRLKNYILLPIINEKKYNLWN